MLGSNFDHRIFFYKLWVDFRKPPANSHGERWKFLPRFNRKFALKLRLGIGFSRKLDDYRSKYTKFHLKFLKSHPSNGKIHHKNGKSDYSRINRNAKVTNRIGQGWKQHDRVHQVFRSFCEPGAGLGVSLPKSF